MVINVYHKLPPMIAGITCAKFVGFLIGFLVFCQLIFFAPELDLIKRVALLFWYPTIAGVAAASNLADAIDLKWIPWTWWQRTVLMGAWLNLMIVLLASGSVQEFSVIVQWSLGHLTSKYWFVVDGAVIGLIAGFVSAKAQKRAELRHSQAAC